MLVEYQVCAQSIGVVANPEAFWGLRPWFESRMDYYAFCAVDATPSDRPRSGVYFGSTGVISDCRIAVSTGNEGVCESVTRAVTRRRIGSLLDVKQRDALVDDSGEVAGGRVEFSVGDRVVVANRPLVGVAERGSRREEPFDGGDGRIEVR